MTEIFAAQMAKVRKEKRIVLRRIYETTGITISRLSAIEKEREKPTIEERVLIKKALGIYPGEIERQSIPSREKLLGHALHGVLVTAGVLHPDSTPTGPDLLLAAEDYMKAKRRR